MEKKAVNIAGYEITQLSETTYEAANPKEQLDFYFNAEDPEEVEVFVFDSLVPNKGDKDPCLSLWYAPTLEEAVTECMTFTKEALTGYEWFTN